MLRHAPFSGSAVEIKKLWQMIVKWLTLNERTIRALRNGRTVGKHNRWSAEKNDR